MGHPIGRAIEVSNPSRIGGRYLLHRAFASGGMASVHFGQLLGEHGFTRIVTVKRLHAQYANDPEFTAMFLDEAHLAARIHHPNVVGTLDVVAQDGELFLVMEYVQGEALHKLIAEAKRRGDRLPAAHAVAIIIGALHGLHAAHEARNAQGKQLEIIHRDVSPQNILVGDDGVARIIDFGIAKAIERIYSTHDDALRGKVAYMAPENFMREPIDRRTDVYATSVVLWELLTGTRFVQGDNVAAMMDSIVRRALEPPSRWAPGLPPEVDAIVLKGLSRGREERFATALDMAAALEAALPPSSQRAVGEWVSRVARETLRERQVMLEEAELSAFGASEEMLASTPQSGSLDTGFASVTVELGPAALDTAPKSAAARRSRIAKAVWAGGALLGALGVLLARGAPNSPNATTVSALPVPSSVPTYVIVAPQEPTNSMDPGLTAPAETSDGVVPPAAPKTEAHSAKTRHHAPPPPKRASCSPPFTLDDGIKVPKLECL